MKLEIFSVPKFDALHRSKFGMNGFVIGLFFHVCYSDLGGKY
jgi:hypothetical protein